MHLLFGLLSLHIIQVLGVILQNQNMNTNDRDFDFATSDFRSMTNNKKYMYIDKTLFIKEVMESQNKTILITRPPRFGKSLTLSALECFFSDRGPPTPTYLSFMSFAIMEPDVEQFRSSHMGKHPVVKLDFSTVNKPIYKESYSAIQEMLSREFSRHDYVLNGNESLNGVFKSILDKTADEARTADSINWLVGSINTFYKGKKRAVILIDGYDTPIYTSFFHNYYDEMVKFMESFLHRTVSNNPYVIKTVITGVTPLAGGILPRNVAAYTVFDDKFSQFFGFFEQDVEKLLKMTEPDVRPTVFDKMKLLYNGYCIGDKFVYNPRGVTQFSFKRIPGDTFDPSLQKFLREMFFGYGLYPILTFQQLLTYMIVGREVSRDLNFPDIKHHEQQYWAFMLHFGYVTPWFKVANNHGDFNVSMHLPNLAASVEIESVLKQQPRAMKIPDYRRLLKDLKNKNLVSARATLDTYLQNGGVYFKRPGEGYDGKRIQDYVLQMSRGLDSTLNLDTPELSDDEKVRVTIKETTAISVHWHRMKNIVCPIGKKIDKNRTTIRIWFNKWNIAACLYEE